MWDCADMPPMFSGKWNQTIVTFKKKNCEFLVFKCILVIHCCFQNKNLSELLKKKYFDSLPLKRMGLS
jgi:hypothetical protein